MQLPAVRATAVLGARQVPGNLYHPHRFTPLTGMATTLSLDLYPSSYAQARTRFLGAARTAGAVLFSQVLPRIRGPENEELALDAAYVGVPDAERVLVMLAGTHGSEGYAASPLLTAFLRESQELARSYAGVGILLVHAVNPYGFAYTLRTNENNVDLNRNFIDFSALPPSNNSYRELHPLLLPADRSTAGRAAARHALAAWSAAHGQAAFFNAVFMGQYDLPEGLMYGGREREWSNLALEFVTRRFLRGTRRIAFIDWHTGLGEYGKPFFLCFNEVGSLQWERCCDWWGRDAVDTRSGFDGAPRPQYSGLVFHGMRRFCASADFSGAVIEFGTTPPDITIEGLLDDNRLRFDDAAALDAHERGALLERAMASFCPSDQDWRRGVLDTGLAISRQAFHGMCAQDPAL